MSFTHANHRSILSRSTYRLATAAVCSALLGCVVMRSGPQDPPDDPNDPPADNPPAGDAPAYQLFVTRAWPVLESCTSCHAGTMALGFLTPGMPRASYTAILGHQPPLIDLVEPAASRLLHAHDRSEGMLNATEADAVLAWIQAEHDAHDHGK